MVPKAGLEPARISPHAPQTCASTNSATWAGFKETDRGARLLCRCSGRVAHDRGPRVRLHDGEGNRREHEQDEECRGQFVQERGRAARAEGCLRSAATEGTGEIRAFPLLNEDDENQEDADDDVKYDENDDHEISGALLL